MMRPALVLGIVGGLLAVQCAAAKAEDITSEGLIEALQFPTANPFLPGQRGLPHRGLEEETTADPPSIDVRIGFAYDSARLDTDAMITLRRLGEALADPRLAGYRFLIGGHTDAKGPDSYNLDLSQRRAEAIRDALVLLLGIEADRLSVTGYGETRLADPANPEAAVNRRVQIVNLGAGR